MHLVAPAWILVLVVVVVCVCVEEWKEEGASGYFMNLFSCQG